ncbi:hypothetical protein Pan241w_43830 [Gimesia alba]|uniref:Uncharacterized protein n=1 Tax=Gimesia alba TaxID=2527973 RepID=A0A517RK61_9PLAN|nr:hypothetical protein [Gimesia alba]QDT44275.1 hypothetical protein Pan241w_43830 [Gimesia alba]
MNRIFTLHLICIIFANSFCRVSLASENSPLQIDEILTVWKQRSERIQSASFEVSVKQTRSKRHFKLNSDEEEEKAVNPAPVEEDKLAKDYITFNLNYSLLFDAPRVFCRIKGQWPDKSLQSKDFGRTMVTDGKYASDLGSFQGHPTGTIYADSGWRGNSIFALKPIRWALCPSDASLGIPLNEFKPIPELQSIDNIQCTVLERDISQNSEAPGYRKIILWITPEQNDCVVLKYALQEMGRTIVAYHCQYDFSQPVGAIPTSWFTIWFFKDGGTRIRIDANVKSHEINPVVEDSDFQIDFPVGTFVTDMRKHDRYNHELNYIVRKNGKKRIVLWEERDKTYDELLASNTPQPTQQINSTINIRFLITVINVILVLVILSIVFYKRYKTKA